MTGKFEGDGLTSDVADLTPDGLQGALLPMFDRVGLGPHLSPIPFPLAVLLQGEHWGQQPLKTPVDSSKCNLQPSIFFWNKCQAFLPLYFECLHLFVCICSSHTPPPPGIWFYMTVNSDVDTHL